MTREAFQAWYEAHTTMNENRIQLSDMSYEIRYENGDSYKCIYTLKLGATRSRYFDTMMDDYTCECFINGVLVSRDGMFIEQAA